MYHRSLFQDKTITVNIGSSSQGNPYKIPPKGERVENGKSFSFTD